MNYTSFRQGNSVVLIAEIIADNEIIEKEWKMLFPVDEFNNINNAKRKREMLTVRLLLNDFIGKPVKIVYDETGKPFAENEDFTISISHCSSYVALMIDYEKHNSGVDIELSNRNVERVIRKFLSVNEQEYMMQSQNPKLTMLLAWSAKEAMYKILGNKAYDFAETLSIEPFEPDENGEIEVTFTPDNTRFSLQYQSNNQYVLVFGNDAGKKLCL